MLWKTEFNQVIIHMEVNPVCGKGYEGEEYAVGVGSFVLVRS